MVKRSTEIRGIAAICQDLEVSRPGVLTEVACDTTAATVIEKRKNLEKRRHLAAGELRIRYYK